jgi:N-glycosylase/DNA lyase
VTEQLRSEADAYDSQDRARRQRANLIEKVHQLTTVLWTNQIKTRGQELSELYKTTAHAFQVDAEKQCGSPSINNVKYADRQG